MQKVVILKNWESIRSMERNDKKGIGSRDMISFGIIMKIMTLIMLIFLLVISTSNFKI